MLNCLRTIAMKCTGASLRFGIVMIVTSLSFDVLGATPLEELDAGLKAGRIGDDLLPALLACVKEGHAAQAWAKVHASFGSEQDGALRIQRARVTAWIAQAAGQKEVLEREAHGRVETLGTAQAQLELALILGPDGWYGNGLDPINEGTATVGVDPNLVDAFVREIPRSPNNTTDPVMALLEQRNLLGPTIDEQYRLARIHFYNGSTDRGLQLAKTMLADPEVHDKHALGLLKVLANCRDWGNALAYIDLMKGRADESLDLKIIRAVALEEEGYDAEAAEAFVRLLDRLDAFPDGPTTAPQALNLHGLPIRRLVPFLPPGVETLNAINSWQRAGYLHRKPPASAGHKAWATEWYGLQFPISRNDVLGFCLSHLVRLHRMLDDAEKRKLDQRISDCGHSALFAFSQTYSDQPMWRARTDLSEAELAWWILDCSSMNSQARRHDPLIAQCIDRFRDRYPLLELLALAIDADADRPGVEAARVDLWECFASKIAPAGMDTQRIALQMLGLTYRKWMLVEPWAGVRSSLGPARDSTARKPLNRDDRLISEWADLRTTNKLPDLAKEVETEAKNLLPNAWEAMAASSNTSLSLRDSAMGFPNYLVRWPRSILWALQVDHPVATPNAENMTRWLSDQRLATVARWTLEADATVLPELETLASSPAGTATDWALAAWVAWDTRSRFQNEAAEQAATLRAARCLQQALRGDVPEDATYPLAAALLRAVLALKERPADLIATAKTAAKRMIDARWLGHNSGDDWQAAFALLDFTDEKERLKTQTAPLWPPEVDRRSQPTKRGNPVGEEQTDSRDIATGLASLKERIFVSFVPLKRLSDFRDLREPAPPITDSLKRQAVDCALRFLRLRTLQDPPTEFENQYTAALESTDLLIEQLADLKSLDAVVKAAQPKENATARQWLNSAAMLLELKRPKLAADCARTAMAINPQLSPDALQLIAAATPPSDITASLLAMDRLDPEALGRRLTTLARPGFAMQDSPERSAECALAIEWVIAAADKRRLLPSNAVGPLNELIGSHTPYNDKFLKHAGAFSALRESVLGRMASEFLQRKSPMKPVADLCKQFRSSQGIATLSVSDSGLQFSPSSRIVEDLTHIRNPTPTLILLQDAWERQAPSEIETIILPLFDKSDRPALRHCAALFFCPEAEFPAAVHQYIADPAAYQLLPGLYYSDPTASSGALDWVVWIWNLRRLTVPLEDIILNALHEPNSYDFRSDALVHYLALASQMSMEETQAVIEKLRIRILGTDPGFTRLQLVAGGDSPRGIASPNRWRRAVDSSCLQCYRNFLRRLSAYPRCSALAARNIKDLDSEREGAENP